MSRRERLERLLEISEKEPDALLELAREKSRRGETTLLDFLMSERARHGKILNRRLREISKEPAYLIPKRRRQSALLGYIRKYRPTHWPTVLAWASRRSRWYGRPYGKGAAGASYHSYCRLTVDLLDLHRRSLIRCNRIPPENHPRRYSNASCTVCPKRSRNLPIVQIPTFSNHRGKPLTAFAYERSALLDILESRDPAFIEEHHTQPIRARNRLIIRLDREERGWPRLTPKDP